MSQRFASGKKALAICDICGFQYKLRELRNLVKKNKITELKVSNKQKTPVYYIICEGNRNPVAQTYDLDKARMLRDQLEDTLK